MKMTALFLSTTLCVSALAGCSGGDTANTANTETKAQAETAAPAASAAPAETGGDNKSGKPATLTVWLPDNIRVEDWKENHMTKWLEEQGNFQLEITTLPKDDYDTKVNMALTAGSVDDLPDVIISDGYKGFTDSQVWSWAQAETIIPLTDYYADPALAVNINEAMERTGSDYTQQIISPDGNIYGVATFNQSYGNEYPHKMWIYKPWLDALGKEMPKTTDEYYELLKLVSQTDLNGNGKADEIGLLGSRTDDKKEKGSFYLKFLMNAFVYAGDEQYRQVNDGVVTASYTTDAWKDGLKYIAKMFDEKMILSESVTMSGEQFKTLMNSEEPTVFSFVGLAPDMITSGTQRSTEYVCLESLTGPDGINYASYEPTVAKISFLVTANCDNPEAAFRFGDLMSSEYIGITQRWGKEGENWDYVKNIADVSGYKASVEGFDMSIITYDDGAFWGGTDLTTNSWRQTGPFVRQYGLANGWAVASDKEDLYTNNTNAGFSLYQNTKHNPAEVIPKLIYTQEEADAIAEIESTLTNYVNECMGKFLVGNKDIDAEWDSYLAELDKIGLSAYLETVQNVYDRMYK